MSLFVLERTFNLLLNDFRSYYEIFSWLKNIFSPKYFDIMICSNIQKAKKLERTRSLNPCRNFELERNIENVSDHDE